jgi:hypothetical protein
MSSAELIYVKSASPYKNFFAIDRAPSQNCRKMSRSFERRRPISALGGAQGKRSRSKQELQGRDIISAPADKSARKVALVVFPMPYPAKNFEISRILPSSKKDHMAR